MDQENASEMSKKQQQPGGMEWRKRWSRYDKEEDVMYFFESEFSFDVTDVNEWLAEGIGIKAHELAELNDHELLARHTAAVETVAGVVTTLLREYIESFAKLESALDDVNSNVRDVAVAVKDVAVAVKDVEATVKDVEAALKQVGFRTPSLFEIEGVDPTYAQKLKDAGISTKEALLHKGASPQGRKEIAEKAGISETLIMRLVSYVDLLRIRGLGGQYAELLEAAGIDAVPELTQRSAEDLYRKLMMANEDIRHILGTLVVARGGMTADELADALGIPKKRMLNALEPVRRFLLGDERVELMHPEFQCLVGKEWFAERELEGYRECLLAYCVRWREHESDYALDHYAAHLFEASRYGQLYGLLDKEWMELKRRRGGAHWSFAEDLELAIRAAEKNGVNGLPDLVSYSLLYATLCSLATNIKPDVLRLLVKWGGVERARGHAEMMMIVEPEQRAEAFQAIAGGGLPPSLQGKLGGAFLRRALEEAQRIPGVEKKAKFLYRLAPELARAGEAEAALVAAEQIDQERPDRFGWFRQEALAKIPVELARAGNAQEAMAALERVDEYSKSGLLPDIAIALAEAGRVTEAMDVAMTVKGDDDELIRRLAMTCHVNEEWLQPEVEKVSTIADSTERAKALASIAGAIEDVKRSAETKYYEKYDNLWALEEKAANLTWLGRYDEALETLSEVDRGSGKYEKTYEELIEGLLVSGRYDDAKTMSDRFRFMNSLREKIEQWDSLWAGLRDLVVGGNPDEALVAIRELHPPWIMADAWVMLGPQLARMGKIEEVISISEEKEIEVDCEMKGPALVVHLARAGMFTEAEMVADRVLRYSPPFLFQAIVGIAGALAGTGKFRDIVPVAERLIREAPGRCEVLAQVAARLAVVDKRQALEILEEALISAESIERAFFDIEGILTASAIELAKLGKPEMATSIAERFVRKNPGVWADIVAESVCHSSEANEVQGQVAFEKLLAFARQIEDDPDALEWYAQRQEILERLAISLARRGQFEKAMTVAAELRDDYRDKPLALAQLAGMLASVDLGRARTLANEALGAARKLHEGEEAKVLIAVELAQAGWLEEAIRIAESLEQEDIPDEILVHEAIALAKTGKIEEAQTLAKELPDTSITMRTIVQGLLEKGESNVAREMIEDLQEINDEARSDILASIALSFARKDQLQETLKTLAKIPSKWEYKPITQLSRVYRIM